MTEHWRPYTSDALRRPLPDDAPRIVGSGEREHQRLALTPNAVIPRFTNSILLDAAGGFVGVLIGLCDVATFLCCFPFVGPVDRGDEGDMGDAIELDRRKDRIDGRRHCDNGNLPRRNAGEHANSGGAVDSIFHLRASPVFTSTSNRARDLRVESGSYERKQWLRAGLCIVTRARMDAGKQGHPIHASNA